MDAPRRHDEPLVHTHNTLFPSGTSVSGELYAGNDVLIDCRFNGGINVPEHHLSIGSSAVVDAKIVARSVTIFGRVDGSITATERVELLASASVQGHVTTPSLLMLDGARFTGTIDPRRTEAAMRVARYRDRQRSQTG